MVIEWLKFCVDPQVRERFIQADAEIWMAFLETYPGFLEKEVWLDPRDRAQLILIVRSDSLERWKAVPSDALAATEAQFARAMGHTYEMLEVGEYQVRKFPARPPSGQHRVPLGRRSHR